MGRQLGAGPPSGTGSKIIPDLQREEMGAWVKAHGLDNAIWWRVVLTAIEPRGRASMISEKTLSPGR